MQKEVLEDEVDTLQSEKDALTIEIETLKREKNQAETAVKGLQTMCSNLASQKALLTSDLDDLQNQLSTGGSVSSQTGCDGRKKDEENEDFRLRCWLHAAKTIKASRYVPTKRKGYDL